MVLILIISFFLLIQCSNQQTDNNNNIINCSNSMEIGCYMTDSVINKTKDILSIANEIKRINKETYFPLGSIFFTSPSEVILKLFTYCKTSKFLKSKINSLIFNLSYDGYKMFCLVYSEDELLMIDLDTETLIYYNIKESKFQAYCKYNWDKTYTNKFCAIFILNKNLFPEFGIKVSLENKNDLIIEKYDIKKANSDFYGERYVSSSLFIYGKINFPILEFEKFKLEKTNQIVIFRNGGMFYDYPLWSDAGTYYPFPVYAKK